MITAGEEMGLTRRDELNHPELEGVGYYSHTIKDGRRVSASTAFLEPARHRTNLTIRTNALVERVVFSGTRAVAVTARVGNQRVIYRAKDEIVLSAGTIMSPKLLQLSGVGPAAHLESVGVKVVCDSPNVGAGMREHLSMSLPYRLEGTPGLNRRYRGLGLIPGFAQYYAFHTGPMATGPFEVGAFARTAPEVDRPDMQLYLSAYSRVGRSYKPERRPGLTIYGQLIHPTSIGSLAITSPDPDAVLTISPNWLSTGHDRSSAVAMVRYMRQYVRQDALKSYTGEELSPGDEHQSDAEILSVFRRLSTSGLHAVGTCGMGRDPAAVVDERLRVRRVHGLRVVDCSVMPGLISGNTSGPAMALGWRAASLLLEDEDSRS